MEKFERVIHLVIDVAVAAFMVILVGRMLTGCAIMKSERVKEKTIEVLKSSFAEGGQTAVSNKIEKLVLSGDISRKQADKIYELSEKLYKEVLTKLEGEEALLEEE